MGVVRHHNKTKLQVFTARVYKTATKLHVPFEKESVQSACGKFRSWTSVPSCFREEELKQQDRLMDGKGGGEPVELTKVEKQPAPVNQTEVPPTTVVNQSEAPPTTVANHAQEAPLPNDIENAKPKSEPETKHEIENEVDPEPEKQKLIDNGGKEEVDVRILSTFSPADQCLLMNYLLIGCIFDAYCIYWYLQPNEWLECWRNFCDPALDLLHFPIYGNIIWHLIIIIYAVWAFITNHVTQLSLLFGNGLLSTCTMLGYTTFWKGAVPCVLSTLVWQQIQGNLTYIQSTTGNSQYNFMGKPTHNHHLNIPRRNGQ